MPPKVKRPYKTTKRKLYSKYRTTPIHGNKAASVIQAAVRRVLFKNAESKNSQFSGTDYQQIYHNNAIVIANDILKTTQGVGDNENTNVLNRIGDKITLQKVQFRMMLEINERFADITYRIMLVKSARGDVPTNSTLFNGLSGNRMLDTINYERYSILYQKWGKIKAAPESAGRLATEDVSIINPGTGIYVAGDDKFHNTRATKIIKFDIAGSKFAKDGIIQYDGGGSAQKFFDYNLMVFAYSNYSTSEAYYVLAVNDYFHRLVYKDF